MFGQWPTQRSWQWLIFISMKPKNILTDNKHRYSLSSSHAGAVESTNTVVSATTFSCNQWWWRSFGVSSHLSRHMNRRLWCLVIFVLRNPLTMSFLIRYSKITGNQWIRFSSMCIWYQDKREEREKEKKLEVGSSSFVYWPLHEAAIWSVSPSLLFCVHGDSQTPINRRGVNKKGGKREEKILGDAAAILLFQRCWPESSVVSGMSVLRCLCLSHDR